jgi:hypothetical protein
MDPCFADKLESTRVVRRFMITGIMIQRCSVKAGVVLGWVTFQALDFHCTLSLVAHPIIMGMSA